MAAGVLIALSGSVPDVRSTALWAVSAVLIVAPLLTRAFGPDHPELRQNPQHLSERMAALTTIVLGETIITVALTGSLRHLYEVDFITLCFEFVVVFSVWSAYFDDVAVTGVPQDSSRQRWWLVTHLPLHLGIIGTAVGLGAFLTLRATADLTDGDIWLVTAPLVLTFVSLGTVSLLTSRPSRQATIGLFAACLGAAALVVLMAWAVWSIPEVTIKQGMAGFGIIGVAYVITSRWLAHRPNPD